MRVRLEAEWTRDDIRVTAAVELEEEYIDSTKLIAQAQIALRGITQHDPHAPAEPDGADVPPVSEPIE